MINAQIILDSINVVAGRRLVTFVLTYPRFIHAQLMTHRVFSRNVSSSRAIPVEKIIKSIYENPASPIVYGKNQRGMYANESLGSQEYAIASSIWHEAMEFAIQKARELSEIGLHKQHANRLLEPFMHVNTILSATEFDNFFNLRLNHDVQPEMKALAEAMSLAMSSSSPAELYPGDWHVPFIWPDEYSLFSLDSAIKVSVARCARVSYISPGTQKISTAEEDFALFGKLKASMHLSPFEHQALALETNERVANFSGWRQLRHDSSRMNAL